MQLLWEVHLQAWENNTLRWSREEFLQWKRPATFLCSHFLAVFHCCPLVFCRVFLHPVLGDNSLLPPLARQMRPLRGSCIQEKQNSFRSLAPLFHFLLFLWICSGKAAGLWFLRQSAARPTEADHYFTDWINKMPGYLSPVSTVCWHFLPFHM